MLINIWWQDVWWLTFPPLVKRAIVWVSLSIEAWSSCAAVFWPVAGPCCHKSAALHDSWDRSPALTYCTFNPHIPDMWTRPAASGSNDNAFPAALHFSDHVHTCFCISLWLCRSGDLEPQASALMVMLTIIFPVTDTSNVQVVQWQNTKQNKTSRFNVKKRSRHCFHCNINHPP